MQSSMAAASPQGHSSSHASRAAAQLVFVAVHAVAQCEPEWRAASSYAGVRGRVDVAEPWDPDGAGPMAPGLVVGGNFEYAGDARVRYVAFYDEVARAFRPIGTGTNGVVSAAVALPGGGLVIGGAFNEAGGVPCSRIARWDGQAWSPLPESTRSHASSSPASSPFSPRT